MNAACEELRALVERVERLEEEIKELNTDKSEVYKEAKARGYDVKALRKVVAARRMDPHERLEQDAVFETYMDALDESSASRVRAHEGYSEAAE